MKLNQRFKITLRSLFLLIGVSLLGVFFWYLKPSPPSSHFAIIPHFMLASQKVDQFYEFLQTKRYMKNDPQTIVIIAPNHFNQRSQTPQTICKASEVYVKNQNYKLTPFP
jgi:predicted class III extradiol MEMO1 family dioxygenase